MQTLTQLARAIIAADRAGELTDELFNEFELALDATEQYGQAAEAPAPASHDAVTFLRELANRYHNFRREDSSVLGNIGHRAASILAALPEPAATEQAGEAVAESMARETEQRGRVARLGMLADRLSDAAQLALASTEHDGEPVAHVKRLVNCAIIDSTGCKTIWEDLPDGTPLYTRPQSAPAVPEEWRAAVTELLASDGSGGIYDATRYIKARDTLHALLAAAPQPTGGA
ncbi:hypothetical protein AAFM71_17140 [Chromobacterium violaceum]|uniref:hypothetical protein n=1 Tax=Chromobacterium violaceum TaxID=536 RepID=UPI00385FBA52